jgi:hypothetical protein
MKHSVILVVFALTTIMVQAQIKRTPIYTYKQKQLNDSLKMLFPDLQTEDKAVQVEDNLFVLQLRNEGTKVGSNSLGEIYSMKTDKIPCLIPFKTKDNMPNAIKSKPLLVSEKPEKQP